MTKNLNVLKNMKVLMIVLTSFLCKFSHENNIFFFYDINLDIKEKVQVVQMKLEMKVVFLQDLKLELFLNIFLLIHLFFF